MYNYDNDMFEWYEFGPHIRLNYEETNITSSIALFVFFRWSLSPYARLSPFLMFFNIPIYAVAECNQPGLQRYCSLKNEKQAMM